MFRRNQQQFPALLLINNVWPIIFVLLCVTSPKLLALPEDSQQPITIQSDRAAHKILKDGSEKTEYFGSVIITQGSISINGKHIVILSKNRQVLNITATGNPASFQQQSDVSRTPMTAKAENIQYQLNKDTIVLANNALIEQQGHTFSGDHIEYNIATEKVDANRGQDDATRVHVTLQPNVKKDPEQ